MNAQRIEMQKLTVEQRNWLIEQFTNKTTHTILYGVDWWHAGNIKQILNDCTEDEDAVNSI